MTEATTPTPRVATRSRVMRDRRLSVLARALYGLLDTYADENGVCWPSNERLMWELSVGRSTLQRALHELQEAGVYTSKQRGSKLWKRVLVFTVVGPHQRGPEVVQPQLAREVDQKRGPASGAPVDNSPTTAPGVVQPASAAGHPRSVDALPTGPINELDTEGVMALVSWSRANMPWSRNGHRRR